MSRLFYHVMQDNLGNLLFDVSGTMRLAGSGTLATIYGDEALTVILPNPMTNHPSFGSFKCYLGASASGYDFYMAKAGYTFETLTGVQGLGTMAQQNASNVAITGGTATLGGVMVPNRSGSDIIAMQTDLAAAGGTNRFALYCGGSAPSQFNASLGFYRTPGADVMLHLSQAKGSRWALESQHSDNDTGPYGVMQFKNVAGTAVGAILTSATTTTYNTSSDARLKEFIETLIGALDVVRALRPVTFRWQADGSPGEGFLAHELMKIIPEAVSGLPDEVHPDGSIKPQQVDHSKLVPWLTAALQETLAQVQALTARVASLETQLGI